MIFLHYIDYILIGVLAVMLIAVAVMLADRKIKAVGL